MTHTWLDHDPSSCFEANNDCCSCGWRCAFNGSGTHAVPRCLRAQMRHADREFLATRAEKLADYQDNSGHENDHFLEGEQGTDIEDSVERNQQ